MPLLETVSFHSGYGVPLWMVTYSGRMPLVTAVPTMLDRFSKLNDGAEIGRIVVIDAEGNSVPFLKGLEQVQKRLDNGQNVTPKLQQLVSEQTELLQQTHKQRLAIKRLSAKTTSCENQLARQQQQLEQHQSEREDLEPRHRIFKHDVELDSIFSVLKVDLVMAITFVLKEYFQGAKMETLTFLERVATLPARLKVLPRLEVVTFEYNQRDSEMMALLIEHCDAINARGLIMRSGRKLQLCIEPAPTTTRPPPRRRTTTPARIVRP